MHASRYPLPFVSALLLACAIPALQAQSITVQELGDDELSCQALYDNIKQMDAVIAQAAQSTSQQQAHRSTGSSGGLFGEMARESGSSEGARMANLFGRLVAGAGGAATQPSVDPAALRAQAQARKQHLTQVFRSKKCKVSTLQK